MREVDLDLSDPQFLAIALSQYLSLGVCPASSTPLPNPFEEVELRVTLPLGHWAIWTGRSIRNMGPGSFLVELDQPPDQEMLKGLLVPKATHDTAGFLGQGADPLTVPKPEPDTIGRATPTTPSDSIAESPWPQDDPAESSEAPVPPEDALEFEDEGTDPGLTDEESDSDETEASDGEAGEAGEAERRRRRTAFLAGFETDRADLHQKINEMAINEKRQLARYGGRTARLILIKDPNKTIHMFVIMNPKISIEEIEEFSKMPSLAAEAIRHIVKNRTWMSGRSVVFNLVRNPATPIDIAVSLVPKLGQSEWRALTNLSAIRAPVAAAARKLLFK